MSNLKRKRILLVEDNANDIDLTLRALKKGQLANPVDIARNGEEALDYIYKTGPYAGRDSGNPAAILLDLKMPKVNGIEVLKKIKADPLKKTIPIVILSSSREDPDLRECYEHGANAYVVKPVNIHEFIEAIITLGMFWAVINQEPPGCAPKEVD